MIEKATQNDLESILRLYEIGIDAMIASGLDQWLYGVYPTQEMIAQDILKGEMYILKEEGVVEAVFVLNETYDAEYDSVSWHFGLKPIYMHRLIVYPDSQGKGIGRQIMTWIVKHAAALGYDCLRLDTYSLNESAMRLYERFEMHRAGVIHFPWREAAFYCYEKPTSDDCPMLPIPMTPAYRYGKDTPWGGSKLQTLFFKQIPDARTGESLEVSVLPSLNSKDAMDVELQALFAKYGERMLGADHDKPFPLLLKLIDAAQALSVQVHPDDFYAAANEDGKLGKEEAWVVLEADEGATLIYGTEPGVTKEMLRDALGNGKEVEALMRRVHVKPMDVLFIPAGCIHAIGGGIVLYEIQQSSDITYRLYDYDRADKNGVKRELHIDDALAVCDTSIALDPIPAPLEAGVHRVLDKKRFILDSALVGGTLPLLKPEQYALLTVMADMSVEVGDTKIAAQKGQSFFIPAACPPITLSGHGRALIAMPPKTNLHTY